MYKIITILMLISFNCFADQYPICTAKLDCKCRCVAKYPNICLCKNACKSKIPEISARIDKENNKIYFMLP